MKLNKKVVAAALAFAFVAPTVANAETTVRKSEDYGKHGVGNYVIHEDYRHAEKAFVEAWNELVDAQADYKAKVEAEAKAKKAFEEASAAKLANRDAVKAGYDSVAYQYFVVLRQVESLEKEGVNLNKQVDALKELNINEDLPEFKNFDQDANKDANPYWHPVVLSQYSRVAIKGEIPAEASARLTVAEAEGRVLQLNNDIDRLNALVREYASLYNAETYAELFVKVRETKAAYDLATQAKKHAKARLDKAEAAYKAAKEAFVLAGGNKNVIAEAEARGDLSLITNKTTKTETKPKTETKTTETVVTEVKPGSVKPSTGLTAEERVALEAAVKKAQDQVNAAEMLLTKFPETVKSVKADLEALLATQKAVIAKAEAKLAEKKTSWSLISTAYAAEEKSDAQKLIDELNENTDKIGDLLDKNEEENKKANEEAAAEKPAEKPEEKPAEKEEKPAEKEEDKKEDKKEEKKPASSNKAAGKNAKTGIAGVAGVAGVLAAASVAYAASKKN